jgi:hypothetical protein
MGCVVQTVKERSMEAAMNLRRMELDDEAQETRRRQRADQLRLASDRQGQVEAHHAQRAAEDSSRRAAEAVALISDAEAGQGERAARVESYRNELDFQVMEKALHNHYQKAVEQQQDLSMIAVSPPSTTLSMSFISYGFDSICLQLFQIFPMPFACHPIHLPFPSHLRARLGSHSNKLPSISFHFAGQFIPLSSVAFHSRLFLLCLPLPLSHSFRLSHSYFCFIVSVLFCADTLSFHQQCCIASYFIRLSRVFSFHP